VYGRLKRMGQEAELGCPEPQARASVIVGSQRHPRLPLLDCACGGRSDAPSLKTTLEKSAGEMQRERWAVKAPWQAFFVDWEGFSVEWVGAGEGQGNCGMVPTPKQCPSWVVANFKARPCNPHTGRRLRFLFHHDSVVASRLTAAYY
jgi:hypothetical protein